MEWTCHIPAVNNPNGCPEPASERTHTKSWAFRYITAGLLLLTVCLPLSAKSRMERYREVLRKTADDLNIQETIKVTGSETDEFYMLEIQHPLGSGNYLNKGIGLNFTSFKNRKSRKDFFTIADAFGKLSKEVYGSVPHISKKTQMLSGTKVLESDCPAYTYKNEVMKWHQPRTRGMRVDITPLVSFSVTTMGGPDPEPYMKQLLKNLKDEGLLNPIEEGVSFRVIAEKEGYVSTSRMVDTGEISPSSITVSGNVMDSQGNPIQEARVRIPSLKETAMTNAAGHFRLSVETKGKKPFSASFTLTLKTPATGMMISFENPDPLPVPGNVDIKIHVKDGSGAPVKAGEVKLKWNVPDFVNTGMAGDRLNREGVLTVPVHLNAPPDPGSILPEPASFRLKLEAVVTPEDGGKPGAATLDVPLNLAMITGTTVGPDMNARPERNAPGLLHANPALFVSRWKDGSGNFRLLIHPLHPVSRNTPGEWWIAWSDTDRLPLEFLLQEAPRPGMVIDVGKVDVLTPQEHINRLRDVAAEFFAAMPLTPSEQSGIQNALRRIVFQDGGVSDVPYFTDNFTTDSGIIHMPGTSEEYWARNLHVEDDSAYEIIPHELGHFTHHHLVERFSYINVCYNKLSTGEHSTWATEPGQLPVKLPYISFSENTADFFALLFRKFWEQRHPEIKDSVYFKRPGYLHEFENDKKAMAVVASMEPGYMVEGVQTRFLRVFYGNASGNRPAAVFSDYLNTMLLHMDRPQGWLEGLVNRPARTIYQWVETKRRMPGAFGPADPVALAARYRLIPGAPPVPTATIAYGEKTGLLLLNGKKVDFGKFPVVPISFGSKLKVTAGTISIDLSDMDTRRTITLRAPTEIVLESRTEITVIRGLVGVDFPATLTTPGGKVTPMGTVVQVRVDEDGKTEVDTLEGTVRVLSSSGAVKMLKAGQSILMDAAGELTTVSTCNPVEIVSELLPKVALPPIPAMRPAETGPGGNWQKRLSSFPWWALVGAVLLIFLVAATLLWLVRRLLAALIIAPLVAAGVLVIGRLLLKPVEAEAFSFASRFVSPLSAWSMNGDWLPAAAWLVGGLVAGFILRGWFRGLAAGLLVPLVPWVIFRLPSSAAMPGSFQDALVLGQQMMGTLQIDFLGLLAIAGLGGLIGGLLIPAKHRRTPPVRRPHARRRYNDMDGDWDIRHSQPAENGDFFENDAGDDGDDDE